MHEEACSEKRAGRRRVNAETALGHLELTPNSKKQAQTLASDASLHCFDLPSTILGSTMTMPSCPSLLELWLDGGERRRPSVSGQSSILCTRLRQPGCVRKCPLLRSTNGYRPPKTLFEARRSVSHLLTVPCCASDHARAESKEASTPSVNSSFNTYHCLHHALIS